MKNILIFLPLLTGLLTCGQPQDRQLIGSCEGCEAVFEYGDRELFPVDTLPDFSGAGMPIRVSGTVYEPDGKTPASGVILYFYHTNQEGIYPTRGDEQGWARHHGYIRGWVKTGPDGNYTIFTKKPAPYPSRSDPAHIHLILLEPDGKYYWIGSYHFEGDPLLTPQETNPPNPRGGSSGLLFLEKQGDLFAGERDILLGKNIPGYE